ncbi:MAG: organomercurial lyase [Candidatus Kariarchaeaceae archaeon]
MTLEDTIYNLHLDVLRRLLQGQDYKSIANEFSSRFEETDYDTIARKGLLSFNSNNKLIGAYPVSPVPTEYTVEIDGIGKGYSMCAIDALGIAYTFNARTTIHSVDHATREPITLEVNPHGSIPEREIFVTYIKSDDPACDPAVDQCPSLNFYTSMSHIQDPESYLIMDLKEASQHAKTVFGEEGIRELIRLSLTTDTYFGLSDRLIDVFETQK